MEPKILFVDDEPNILEAFRRQLGMDYDISIAVGPEKGLSMLSSKGPYDVVISDMRMPGMDGVEFLRQVSVASPDTVRVMLTGNADLGVAIRAVNESNIFRFLTKPCSSEDLGKVISDALEYHRLLGVERELLDRTLSASVKVLTDIISAVDPEHFHSSLGLRQRVRAVGTRLGIKKLWELELATMLSEVGSCLVPRQILYKVREGKPLSIEEDRMISRIPELGSSLVAQIPRLENVAQIIKFSRKNFDGSGPPSESLSGEDIPVGSRILRILKDSAALERSLANREQVLATLRRVPYYYDPELLEAIISFEETKDVREEGVFSAAVRVPVTALQDGSVIDEDIRTTDEVLLVPKGTVLNTSLIERVRNYASFVGLKSDPLVRTGKQGPPDKALSNAALIAGLNTVDLLSRKPSQDD